MHMEKVNKAVAFLKDLGLSQMLVSDPAAIFYMTGRWIHPGERFLALCIGEGKAPVLILNELFQFQEDIGIEKRYIKDTDDITEVLKGIVDPEETHKSLTDKQRALLPGLVRDLCADLPGLWAAARPQGAGDYWPCPTERDWTIGPDTDLETADKVLRAFYTYEVIYDDGADRWELIDGLLYDGPQPGMLAFPFRGKTICARRARRLST